MNGKRAEINNTSKHVVLVSSPLSVLSSFSLYCYSMASPRSAWHCMPALRSLRSLRALWHVVDRLGSIVALLGAILGRLGAILARFGAILACLGAILGRLG